jgi:hypothetical protein
MKDPKHNNLVVFYHKVNSVRESPKQTAPEFAMNLWVKEWILRNLAGTGIKYPKEFLSKPR